MMIAGVYSFKGGKEEVQARYPDLLAEVRDVVCQVDASRHKTKISEEKTMRGKVLYNPRAVNDAFKAGFALKTGWQPIRVPCEYSTEYYVDGYQARPLNQGAFREMDFVKKRLGVEVQFGKYAFMVYNVCAKMSIFKNLGHIDCGIEIVPVKAFADQMSTGVSYFEQFLWDLEERGVADIDIPVMILGVDAASP